MLSLANQSQLVIAFPSEDQEMPQTAVDAEDVISQERSQTKVEPDV